MSNENRAFEYMVVDVGKFYRKYMVVFLELIKQV